MIPFNYHHLYYFYTIARLGSITKACSELRLAQPTLSSQLKQFESHLNLQLFERQGKKLVLTEKGHHILSYATEIFDTGRELVESLDDISEKSRFKIQIGISRFIPRAVVDALLNFLIQIEPSVLLAVHEDRMEFMLEGLETHSFDFILTDTLIRHSAQNKIEEHLLAKIPVLFCAHHSVAHRYQRLPKDLHQAPMILPTTQSQIYQSLQEYFVAHKIEPKIIAEIQDVELARRLVLTGIGIAPLNLLTITQAPSKEPLHALNRKSSPAIFDNIYLLTKKRKKRLPLIDKILEQFKI